ncbi:MAG: TIR domain-containing protein [Rhodomicrobium sp.]
MKTLFEHDIFISYSQKDREAAERLQAAFEAHKLKVWRDERLLDNPEHGFISNISTALERSAKAVVLWSRNSVSSAWVQAEAEKARHAQKIVALALEPLSALLPFIPMPFNILPTIDVSAATPDLAPVLRALGAEQIEGQPEGVMSLVTADVDISKLPDTYAKKLYGRDREMAALVAAWDNAVTRIFAFDAMGGAGKTALVYHFVQALKASGWRGARSIFAWSFYSQGSNEDRQTSADDFFKAAYRHFSGGKMEPPRDPHQKGVDLAHLVQAHRALLILDGLEPLQYAAGARGGSEKTTQVGGIKDPGVKALLSLLSDNNPGLCIVTTRIKLAELAGAEGVTFEELDEIPLMDAIALLRDLGVAPDFPPNVPLSKGISPHPVPLPIGEGTPEQGTERATTSPLPEGEGQGEGRNLKAANDRGRAYKLPPAREFAALVPPYKLPATYTPREGDDRAAMPALVAKDLIEAVKELKGHALALTLVGRFLAEHHHGDIRAIHDLPDLAHLDPAAKERAPYRVMRAIEIALANRIAEMKAFEKPAEIAAGRQLALLFFLGFFDRPAERELLPVVFRKAAGELKPDPADIELAKADLIAIKRQLWEFDEKLHEPNVPEWRRQEIERDKEPLISNRQDAIEASRRVLVRRLFAEMHAYLGEEDKITNALSQLADQGLVSRTDDKTAWKRASIDCHPLVREYFGARLKELDGATFRAGHGRLYDQYRYVGLPQAFCDPVVYGVLALVAAFPQVKDQVGSVAQWRQWPEGWKHNLPPTLLAAPWGKVQRAAALIGGAEWDKALKVFLPRDEAGMNPLFSAIAHGCAAEQENGAFTEVYMPRIQRGSDNFAANKLGLYGQELAALASFFEKTFTHPSPRLSAINQGPLLNFVGFRLQGLGRLADATAPMRAANELAAKAGHWENAAIGFGTLSNLLVTIGRLSGDEGAVAAGKRAVAFAERSENAFQHLARITDYGDALFQKGMLSHAEALFREAEVLQAKRHPNQPILSTVQGYQYCDLLLFRNRCREVTQRYNYFVASRSSGASMLGFALEELVIARLALSASPPTAVRSEAALADLRQANVEQELPRGLITHAETLWRCGDTTAADESLREAETIAQRGPMPLFMADAQLLRARIQLSEHRLARARHYRDAAAALIEAHGYGRAAPELAVLDAEIASAENAPNREAALAAAITAIRGEPYRDERTGITIDGGWWGLLPRLEALLPADHPELASLRAARDAYNAERDAYLAAEESDLAAKQAKEWEEEDRALADPDFRRELSSALVRAGYKPLDETPIAEQRNDARNYLKQKREAQGKGKAQSKEADLPEVPDALLDQLLADPKARAAIQHRLTQAGVTQPFDRMPREAQRHAVAAMMAAMQEAKAETEAPEAPDIPDELVRHVFAAPETQELLRDVMQQNGLPGAPADLPFEMQRAIAAALMKQGIIQMGEAPRDEPPPAPPQQPGNGKKGGGWWPFGRKH